MVSGLPGEAEATASLESAGASALSFLDSLLEYKEKTPTRSPPDTEEQMGSSRELG